MVAALPYRLVLVLLILRFQVDRVQGYLDPVEVSKFVAQIDEKLIGNLGQITVFVCDTDIDQLTELALRLSKISLASSFYDIGNKPNLGRFRDSEGLGDPKVGFVLDLECPDAEQFLLQANKFHLLSSPFKWLMFQNDPNNENSSSTWFSNLVSRLDIYPESEILVVQRRNDDYHDLLSFYRTDRVRSENVVQEPLGFWMANPNHYELTISDNRPTSRRRRDLQGTHLRSCLVITNPDTVNHLTDNVDTTVDTITKSNYPWALMLVESMNATVSFVHAGTWGYLDRNGSWGGMVGMLQRDEIDFGGTGSFFVRERIGIVQYIPLSTPTGSKFIFRRPPLSTVANLFTLPFSRSVWLAIFALTLLHLILLYLTMRWEWFGVKKLTEEEREYALRPGYELERPTLSDDFLVVMGAVSQQGSWYEPRALQTRIIFFVALVAALNLYAAYTANIVALLQSTTDSIKTLEDLYNSPLTLACDDNVYNRYYFKSFKDPIRRAVYENRIEPRGKKSNWLNMEEGVRRIRAGHFAFHVEPGCAYKLVQKTFEEGEKCGFQEIDMLNVFHPHFLIQRHSPYLEIFRVGSIRMQEVGLKTRQLNMFYTKKPACGSESVSFVSVSLTESYAAFITQGTGMILALLILIGEIVYWKTKFLRERLE